MRIQFLGADRTVTGSSHLLDFDGRKVLLDCGMFQGPREQAKQFNHWVDDELLKVDAVVLSHGHLDHCGKLPVLVRAGLNVPIYCTEGTAGVTRVVLTDSGQIQQEDAEYLNRRQRRPDEPPMQPLYTGTDVQRTLKLLKTVRYGQSFEIAGATFTLHDAGHILGSAFVTVDYLENGEKRSLLFTGDVGRYNTPIINDPSPLPGVFDTVITEATYGGRQHASMDEVAPQLLEAVQYAIAHKSRLIVPSFAVGRTQTILWYMQKFLEEKKIPPTRIYVDSPMGVEMTKIYAEAKDYFDAETSAMAASHALFANPLITLASSGQQSREINADRGPCVIIASSPTCEFGRVLHHLKQSLERRDDTVIFVGFTPYNTLGRRLQDGAKRVKLYDRYYDVNCRVKTIHGLSAHADSDELIRFLTPTLNSRTHAYVVHGEPDQQTELVKRMLAGGIGSATIPAVETEVFSK